MKRAETIEVKTIKGNMILRLDSIVFLEAKNRHTIIVLLKNIQIESINSLMYFEHIMPKPYFFRCHKKYIINCQYVNSFNHTSNQLLLSDSMQLQLSRYRKNQFIDNLHKFKLCDSVI